MIGRPVFRVTLLTSAALTGFAWAEAAPAPAETPDQAEQRVEAILALMPPSRKEGLEKLMFPRQLKIANHFEEVVRRVAGMIEVRVPLVHPDGTPVMRDREPAEPSDITMTVDSSEPSPSLKVRLWKPGYAPHVGEIVLPEGVIEKAGEPKDEKRPSVEAQPVVLERGVAAAVRIVSPDGEPLAAARVIAEAVPIAGNETLLLQPLETDGEGVVSVNTKPERFMFGCGCWLPAFFPKLGCSNGWGKNRRWNGCSLPPHRCGGGWWMKRVALSKG